MSDYPEDPFSTFVIELGNEWCTTTAEYDIYDFLQRAYDAGFREGLYDEPV